MQRGLCHGLVAPVLCCFAGGAPDAAAQTGEIAGAVVDATGGVLPGATVALSGGSGAPRQAQTDAQGGSHSPACFPASTRLRCS